jgi:hypothetical protein
MDSSNGDFPVGCPSDCSNKRPISLAFGWDHYQIKERDISTLKEHCWRQKKSRRFDQALSTNKIAMHSSIAPLHENDVVESDESDTHRENTKHTKNLSNPLRSSLHQITDGLAMI